MSYARLTARQREVVDFMLAGNRQEQIAKAMGITTRSVKMHIHMATLKSHIDSSIFSPQVRLVYLRARELRLI
jgi:DNA-binding CsgD family transcriptional regulator